MLGPITGTRTGGRLPYADSPSIHAFSMMRGEFKPGATGESRTPDLSVTAFGFSGFIASLKTDLTLDFSTAKRSTIAPLLDLTKKV